MQTTELIGIFLKHLSVDVATGQLSNGTREFYRNQLKHLDRHAGKISVQELSAADLVGLKLTHHLVRAIKRLSKFAVEAELLGKDPFRKLRAPRCGQRQRVVSDAELLKLYRSAPIHFRRVLFTLLHSCARPQEVRQWRWGDVDLENRVVTLGKFKASEQRRDGIRLRVIPLDLALTEWLRREARRKPDPTECVFVDSKGKPWTSNGIRCAMRRTREKAGIGRDTNGERIVSYSLRHSGATRRAQAGIRDSALSEMLGHTKSEMTRRYIHRTGSDLVRLIDQAERKIGNDS